MIHWVIQGCSRRLELRVQETSATAVFLSNDECVVQPSYYWCRLQHTLCLLILYVASCVDVIVISHAWYLLCIKVKGMSSPSVPQKRSFYYHVRPSSFASPGIPASTVPRVPRLAFWLWISAWNPRTYGRFWHRGWYQRPSALCGMWHELERGTTSRCTTGT